MLSAPPQTTVKAKQAEVIPATDHQNCFEAYITETISRIDQDSKAGEVIGLASDDCGVTRTSHTFHFNPIECPGPSIFTATNWDRSIHKIIQSMHVQDSVMDTYSLEKFQ